MMMDSRLLAEEQSLLGGNDNMMMDSRLLAEEQSLLGGNDIRGAGMETGVRITERLPRRALHGSQ
jgi:hypothetical protein